MVNKLNLISEIEEGLIDASILEQPDDEEIMEEPSLSVDSTTPPED